MAQAGISTLGTLFGYAVESTKGTKPSAFTLLNRVSSIGGISLETEKLDASTLEDAVSRYVSGRMDTGGSFSVTVNVTDETITEWTTLISAYQALTGGKRMWFEVYNSALQKAYFIVAEPPTVIPMPEWSSNEVLTMEMSLTVEEYVGVDTAIVPTAGA